MNATSIVISFFSFISCFEVKASDVIDIVKYNNSKSVILVQDEDYELTLVVEGNVNKEVSEIRLLYKNEYTTICKDEIEVLPNDIEEDLKLYKQDVIWVPVYYLAPIMELATSVRILINASILLAKTD